MATRRKAKAMKVRHAKKRMTQAKAKARPKSVRKAAKRVMRKAARKMVKRAVARTVPHKKAVRRAPARRRATMHLENVHVRNLLTELAGEKALKVVGEMTEPMSDEDISKCAGIKISDIRAVLNKLHAAGVASYDRTRNDEGWYTYTWRLTMDNAFKILEEKKATEQRGAREMVLEGAADHYVCPLCTARTGAKLSFEQAVEAGFRCPDCSEMLHYVERKR